MPVFESVSSFLFNFLQVSLVFVFQNITILDFGFFALHAHSSIESSSQRLLLDGAICVVLTGYHYSQTLSGTNFLSFNW